jgi:glycosyltransferase involved in cell wall biosynthesis
VSPEPEVRTSVVIPAYRAAATLPRVLDALAPQLRPGREALLVESGGDGGAEEYAQRWPWLDVIALARRALPGEARNIGVRHAEGRLIAFLDADAVPGPGWLDRLERRMTDDLDAVSGAVLNGTPDSSVGTAEYLLEFSEWMPGRRRPLQHAATCNLLVRRGRFEAQGGLAEDLRTGEDTAFTFPIAAEGRLGFAPQAIVRHLNRTALRPFLANQRRLGFGFVEVCERVPLQHGWVSHGPGLAMAIPLRLLALARGLRANPADAARALRVLPLIAVGLIAWMGGVLRASAGRGRRAW